MIKFSPVRRTLSASLKEERLFHSLIDMQQYIFEHWHRLFSFVGIRRPILFDDVNISDIVGNDDITGYRNVRFVHVDGQIVGFCGE